MTSADCASHTLAIKRGYRLQIHLNKGKRKTYTRNGLDWTKRFSVIAGALDIPGQAILDGEVTVIKDGRTNFSELQAELAAGRQDRLVFYAFDLLYLNGFDLRRSPQIERKRLLKALLEECEGPVLYSDHLVGVGQEMFEHAAKLNWEGIVSKNADAPYRSDRNEGWIKIKTSQRAKFPVIGFVKEARSHRSQASDGARSRRTTSRHREIPCPINRPTIRR